MKTQLTLLLVLATATVMARPGGGGGSGGGPRGQGGEDGREAPTGADFVARLDQDGDGKISSDEFDGPSEHFSQLDKDSDGYIGEDEAPTGPPPRQQQGQQEEGQQKEGQQNGQRPPRGEPGENGQDGDFVTRLDKDGDSKVSSDEFDGPSDHFSQLDKNSDGFISKDEAPTGPPPRGRK